MIAHTCLDSGLVVVTGRSHSPSSASPVCALWPCTQYSRLLWQSHRRFHSSNKVILTSQHSVLYWIYLWLSEQLLSTHGPAAARQFWSHFLINQEPHCPATSDSKPTFILQLMVEAEAVTGSIFCMSLIKQKQSSLGDLQVRL